MFDVQQTIEDLQATISYLRDHKWTQGRNFTRLGACCAWGAALMATGDIALPPARQDRSSNVARAFYRLTGQDIMAYNDHPGRTKDQVIGQLETTLTTLKSAPSLLTAKKEKTDA